MRPFFLLGEASKPVSPQEGKISPTGGKIVRMARASLANGGGLKCSGLKGLNKKQKKSF